MNSFSSIDKNIPEAPIDGLTGTLAQLVDYIVSTAIQPQPALAVGASLCALGALMGQRYRTETDLRSNLYVVGVSSPNSGKSHVLRAIDDLFRRAWLHEYIWCPIKKTLQLYKQLLRHPCLLWQYDDCSSLLQNAATGPKVVLDLSILFKNASGVYRILDNKGVCCDIQEPCLCLSWMTTPQRLQRAIIKKGFLDSPVAGKTIIIPSFNNPEYNQVPDKDIYPQKLIHNLREIAAEGLSPLSGPRQRGASACLVVGCTSNARAAYWGYAEACWQLCKDGGERRILSRLANKP